MSRRYTEGICHDGAAILDNGKMLTISEILNRLNENQSKVDALVELVEDILRYQAWSDINQKHIKVFEEKLKEIQGDK